MKLWLVRHPAVEAEPGLCYGRLDLPLREPAALDRIATTIPPVDAVITSPASRCRLLAERIARSRNIACQVDARWQELNFGAWEGRRWDDVPGAAWAADYWTVAPPGGETYRALIERVEAALAELAVAGERSIAIVGHAGSLRAALALCLGWERERFPDIEFPCGAVVGLHRTNGKWARC